MDTKRGGPRSSSKGPAEYFTGTLHIAPLFQANDPARTLGASVMLEPGARTAWHTQPLGQTLIVTASCGAAPGKEHGTSLLEVVKRAFLVSSSMAEPGEENSRKRYITPIPNIGENRE